MKFNTNKKAFYGILILLLIFIAGVIYINKTKKTEEYQFPSPEEVVRDYFISWNNKDYPNMYATLSDGFKRIEPTAKDLSTFREFVSSQKIKNISILNIKENSNDMQTAVVDYSVEFFLENGVKSKFDGTFTLKFRQADIIRGWKLIHPYGENIDRS